MVQYSALALDSTFAALSDATRRDMLRHLVRAEATISDLASRFHMTLTGMKKHVALLERAGLVVTQKVGRVRICRIDPNLLTDEAAWIEDLRQLWQARFQDLDAVVAELARAETALNIPGKD